ncbi:SAM-dependent methyltransferase [Chroococcidiopsis sp. CCALA 051]|uniref:class I SAM-dependent methyltransferase n=1 Tax=Chroococcidiopsis sp. CCALA 051 TaxID=869949 RepID=UPI000D0D7F16|nr:class I SAM-dependent methyltransferase [Chroococcidiopsis sp. CCALA 051]PSM47987.1 SAM-dependent methyltransferase [Chroococcidiopsis sp. CCALA 051]
MSDSTYIFTNSQPEKKVESKTVEPKEFKLTETELKELARLQAIERVFDPASRQRIQATGISPNWCCLEVGAGAGSIARWMAEIVGENGKVVAVDLNTRFVAKSKRANIEIIESDIRHLALKSQSFDLIHTRYVLIHVPEFQVALAKMLDLLKPGGWIVIEEPDFSAARAIAGNEAACQSMNRVNEAIAQMFASRGMDYAFGVKLPTIFQQLNLQELSVENDTPLAPGGSGIATVMKMSAERLADKYIATGKATQQDIERYCQIAEDPQSWAIYYSTIGATARKVVSKSKVKS